MDFNAKQWRPHDSDQEKNQQQPLALPLFASEPNTNPSPFFSDHKINRMGSYFSLSQWQELELQALIFRHMISGADVPPELLHLVKKSVLNSPYYHCFPHYQPSLLQSGYWGRAAMDPEPGRCRRTDGKKWRCARDVVAGQKYCERHMHRGKNRSRKPVETPASTTSPYGGSAAPGEHRNANNSVARQVVAAGGGGGGSPHFTLSVASHSTDLLHFNSRPPGSIIDSKGPFEAQNDGPGRTTRHFFDDWPKPIPETDNGSNSVASATNLSISMPGNPSSDFSLKLGTGNGETMWGTNHPAAPMGGPLAEALRSSMSTSSPTSVLHRLPRGIPASEASYISY